MEGICQSYMHLFRELGITSLEALQGKNAGERLRKVWNEYAKSGHIRHANFLRLWADLFIGFLLMYLIRLAFLDDPEMLGMSNKSKIQMD